MALIRRSAPDKVYCLSVTKYKTGGQRTEKKNREERRNDVAAATGHSRRSGSCAPCESPYNRQQHLAEKPQRIAGGKEEGRIYANFFLLVGRRVEKVHSDVRENRYAGNELRRQFGDGLSPSSWCSVGERDFPLEADEPTWANRPPILWSSENERQPMFDDQRHSSNQPGGQ
uniref:Uncharacterized protein n=1 Tax=Trichuris muris TaxID=70415 RepID=A0A5S6QV68_TRIMR